MSAFREQYKQLQKDLQKAKLLNDVIIYGKYDTLINTGYKDEDIELFEVFPNKYMYGVIKECKK